MVHTTITEKMTTRTRVVDLPTEIEREIFEVTARLYPGTAVKLAVLARKTQIWMEQYIYETVVLDFPEHRTDSFLQTIDTRPPQFFAGHVKKLYFTCTPQYTAVQKILSVCTGLTNLTCWSNGPVIIKPPGRITKQDGWLLALLPNPIPGTLSRLSVKLEDIAPTGSIPDFSVPLFQGLTHLEIVNPPRTDTGIFVDWSKLYTLPKLKHLTLGRLVSWQHMYLIPVIRGLLRNCAKLETLVVLTKDLQMITAMEYEYECCLKDDGRVVVLPQFHYPKDYPTYWRDVGRGEPDFWEVSEGMAVEQKARMDSARRDSDVEFI